MRTSSFMLLTIALLVASFTNQSNVISQTNSKKGIENYTGPIIDMHAHAFTTKNMLFGLEYTNPLTKKTIKGVKTPEEQQEKTFAKFKKHNIVKAMVSNGSSWYTLDSVRVIIGESHMNSIDDLRQKYKQKKLHVLGEVAPNYQGLLPTDPSLVPYFDLANELNIPVAFHMYPGGPPGGAYFAYPNTRAIQGKPLQLEEILFSRPKMKIYIMHAGWPYLEDMKALMYAHPQVYVDLGVICWAIPRKEFHHFLKGLVNSGFSDRIMFGSDQMVWPETIDQGIEAVNSADFLTLKQKEDIFYNNAARFLGLSDEEIKRHKGYSK